MCVWGGGVFDHSAQNYNTHLPLNLANNKQQQATSNTSSFRFGHHSVPTLRVLCSSSHPRAQVVALPKPRLSQRLTASTLGWGRQVGRCPPKSVQFTAKSSHFSPKTAPQPPQSTKTIENACHMPQPACFACAQEPLRPPHPLYIPETAQKWPTMRAVCVNPPQNQEWANSWVTWLKSEFRGHHSQAPTFCGFHPSELSNETPRPPYQWSLGAA